MGFQNEPSIYSGNSRIGLCLIQAQTSSAMSSHHQQHSHRISPETTSNSFNCIVYRRISHPLESKPTYLPEILNRAPHYHHYERNTRPLQHRLGDACAGAHVGLHHTPGPSAPKRADHDQPYEKGGTQPGGLVWFWRMCPIMAWRPSLMQQSAESPACLLGINCVQAPGTTRRYLP